MNYDGVIQYAIAKTEEFLIKGNGPGVGIGIVTKDRILLSKGFGIDDIRTDKAFTPSTTTLLASVSKPISGTLVAMLSKSYPQLDIYNTKMEIEMKDAFVTKNLTVRDLLSHHGGIPEQYGTVNEALGYSRNSIMKNLKHVDNNEFRNKEQYTNIPFTAAVIKATERANITKEKAYKKMFNALRMNNTSIDYEPEKYKGYFQLSEEVWYPIFNYNVEEQISAGGIYSNVNDMNAFLRFHLHQLSVPDNKKIIDSIFYKGVYVKPEGNVQGVGIDIKYEKRDDFNYRVFSHSGALENVRTRIIFSPECDIGIYISVNSVVNAFPEVLGTVLFDILLGSSFEEAETHYDLLYPKVFDIMNAQIYFPNFGLHGNLLTKTKIAGKFTSAILQELEIKPNGTIKVGKLEPVSLYESKDGSYGFLLENKFEVPYSGTVTILNTDTIKVSYFGLTAIYNRTR